MIGTIVSQLTKDATLEELERAGLGATVFTHFIIVKIHNLRLYFTIWTYDFIRR